MINKHSKEIAIIGGGVAGSTAALYFGKLGLDVTLFEKESTLISGPPFCHLHAGGNLYREISDTQCVTLLKQSIDFLRFFPYIVDYRPTVIALPTTDKSTPKALLPRLNALTKEYQSLIDKDPKNEVLGKSEHYYKTYTKEELLLLKEKKSVSNPRTHEEWMIPVAKHIDLEKVQFPLILVQEYGLNLFRLSAGVTLTLESLENVTVYNDTIVYNIQKDAQTNQWNLFHIKNDETCQNTFDYLINATGFRTGKIDDFLGVPCERMVEFKAAYVSRWATHDAMTFPEIIFHGERGTPQGMGQFTPYPHGYFQLHGMTNDITLYEDGLVSNSKVSCQPKLGQDFIDKIEKEWKEEETITRTNAAIQHLSQYIPSFSTAQVGSKPLFGAQQIPGDDPTLRVAEVSFPREHYARCEIVKVSSVLDMCEAIASDLEKLGYIDRSIDGKEVGVLEEKKLKTLAQKIALSRDYPVALALRTTMKVN
ncbi:MAG: FAD-binding oxidoreductase [Sulfurovum sp.]|nr:FAD-binding oxidoreductase [Sulfurovum sp.]